jgi:hypothetical protein
VQDEGRGRFDRAVEGADEDDVPGLFATLAEEVELWRTHTLDGQPCKPLKPFPIERRKPDLRVTGPEPMPDLFGHFELCRVERRVGGRNVCDGRI